jgi:cation diffusion facilitator CzcD-associated flavoprotein CzcO/acetyl esterase/lipase
MRSRAEGGDPACWAHLFDSRDEADDAATGPRTDDSDLTPRQQRVTIGGDTGGDDATDHKGRTPMAAGNGADGRRDVDVVVVGAGMSGLYLLHRQRQLGFSTVVLESADDVGGTWYWNRYPGARCDISTTDYTYSFDPELEDEWSWSEKYATQPEILRYLQFVAERYDLRRDIRFSTRVETATWDDDASRWRVRTDAGDELSCQFYVMASGCLSLPKTPDIEGTERFAGDVYFTSRWPHEGVDFTGKRVAVIGTGSSAIQSIPIIAEQAEQLTVFQRTANFSLPAHNGPPPADAVAALEADRAAYREAAKRSRAGVPIEAPETGILTVSEQERREMFEAAWAEGGLFSLARHFNDYLVNPEANEILCELFREKIRSIVEDPDTADSLCPKDHPFGTKRPCVDTNYFQTYNLPHVRLVDLRKQPITTITETGIDTAEESFEFDAIVYATGFDAMTGAIVAVDITGRDGITLKQRWADGPLNYLGLTVVGFPNFFTITGPGSPSVLSNMSVSIEQHVDWVSDCLTDMRQRGFEVIEPTEVAEAGWVQHANDCADITLFPRANSWYLGANVPGKPRVLLPYIGGVDSYRAACDEVVERGYLGFRLEGPAGVQCNDGVIRRVQPDVQMVLDLMASLELPPLESMSPAEARAFMEAASAQRPPGPEVAEIVDGVLLGAAGELTYRLYRPHGEGPHPIIAYFHGGGWVLGSADSDDPLCRDLCVRSDAVVVSVDYRHAPEDRFPAAADDAFAALRWIAAHAIELGGIPGQLAVAGWSAGGNVAAVACHLARDTGGPDIVAKLLINPVTDSDLSRPSYQENGEGYALTTAIMEWFWDHYADPSDRAHPKAAPLRAEDLSGLPPTVIVTGEFDPLRDEGVAYARALEAADNKVVHLAARGHTHTSLTMVDVIISAVDVRAEMVQALTAFFDLPESAGGSPTAGGAQAAARA